MKFKYLIGLLIVLMVVFWLLNEKTYYRGEEVTFIHNKDTLKGLLNIPKNKKNEAIPLAIFVHGDGAVSADNYGYEYIWNALAKNGIASISWSKKGVDKSTGNWLNQSMTDRAHEVNSAVNFITQNYSTQFSKIGLLGFSQGCWVVPKVCATSKKIDFAILVSGAINWKRQSNYLVKKRLEKEGKNKKIIEKAIEENIAEFNFFSKKHTYVDYIKHLKSKKPNDLKAISFERFPFIKKNINSDATEDLTKIKCAVFGAFGDADENVDFKESYTTYDSIFSKTIPNTYKLKVYPNANHELLKAEIFSNSKSEIETLTKLEVYGKKSFANDFLEDIVAFILI